MRDLKDSRLMYLKGVLFLISGSISITALLLQNPSLQTAFLIVISIWSFCRLYYFMFYVIEKYIDPTFRFAGLWSVLVYLARRGGRRS